MPKVIRKPPSKQTRAEKLINLKAARAAKKRGITKKKHRRKQKTPRRYHKTKDIKVKRKPMAKRRRYNTSLTGGTQDVNPQYLSGRTVESAATTWTSTEYMLPVARVPTVGNKATVIEVIKVFFDMPAFDVIGAAGETNIAQLGCMYTGSAESSVINFNNPKIFAMCEEKQRGAFTAGGSYRMVGHNPHMFDCSDGAGHGILIATDSFNVGVLGIGKATAITMDWKILYRFKRVNLTEYLGIVQSQQGA